MVGRAARDPVRSPASFPRRGWIALGVIAAFEFALVADYRSFWPHELWFQLACWVTPACWWAYLVALDAWLHRSPDSSLLSGRRRLFALQCILSVAFWSLFEAYNRMMPAWTYLRGVFEKNTAVRFTGYALAFATILPAVFLTAEFISTQRWFADLRLPPVRWTTARLRASGGFGALCCFGPPFFGENVGPYLWGLVWCGWIFLLEPFNYWRGMPSLFRDWERGDWSRSGQLFAAGVLCGVLWEFWNYWARVRWEYTFPLMQQWKFFEMPVVGFPGFLPFALELFVMFQFIASFFSRDDLLKL